MKSVTGGNGLRVLCLLWLSVVIALPAAAHRLRPAVVTVTFLGDGAFDVAIRLNLEAFIAGIGPEHQDTRESANAPEYDALRELRPDELRQRFAASEADFLNAVTAIFDGESQGMAIVDVEIPVAPDISVERLSTLTLAGTAPPGAGRFTWSCGTALGECALRVGTAADGVIRSEWLTLGAVSEAFPLAPGLARARGTWEVFKDYTVLGFTHILPKGLDHILFVLGIFLLSLRWRPLLYQVTAFTIAHTITLALSLYGIVSLPSSVVEPLIALSIVYVAIENIATPILKPWRVYVVFAFGLLHGMGFAGVLTELGLPRNEFVTALVAFNVGVEFGQLAVIALAFAAVGLWFRHRSWYRRGIVVPASLVIALIGAYWTVERVTGFG